VKDTLIESDQIFLEKPMRILSFTALLLAAGCTRVTPVEEVSVDPAATFEAVASFVPGEGDWPGWRGPSHNGIAGGTAVTSWSPTENVIWKTPVPGRGHSSPVVCGDRVFLATAIEGDEQQLVVAFDRAGGDEVWRTVLNQGGLPSTGQMHQKGTHANGTVACDDQTIFTAFLNHDSITASAVDFDGQIVWQTKLGAFNSKFGYAPSPIIYQSLVIFAADNHGGGYLAAVHRRSGEIVWRKERSRSSTYSSPVVATVAGRDQLLICGGNEVCSYDPGTGELIWSCEGTADATCGTMVWNDSLVFASGGYPEKQTLAVRADGSCEVVWSDSVKSYEPSMLLVGDELYAATDNGIAYCWDAATGELHWRQRLQGSFSASPLFCDGKIYVTNTKGTTFVFRPTSGGYEQLAKNQLGNDAFATPAVSGGQILMRVGTQGAGGRQEVLYCLGSSHYPPSGGSPRILVASPKM
jgi:outer membrane protein assembly factor BamB